jgi:hypothetical protein
MKHLPKMNHEKVAINQILFVPMLAKKLTMKEASDYEVQNIDMRFQYCEKLVNPNSATCYSIDKSSFNPQNMV